MDILEKRILSAFPISEWKRRRLCLAASGGADSVALLCAFAAIANENGVYRNLHVVTVDHQLRGEESDEDVEFVRALANKMQLSFEVRTINRTTLAAETKRLSSLENAARNLRYQLLKDAAKDFGARFLLTAHHLDDQLETILFRLFRGSGLDGLQGISSTRPLDSSIALVRPMLRISKREILDYLNRLKQDFRVDSTNEYPNFIRNRIRNELIPLLNDTFPNRWKAALLRLSQQSRETSAYLDDHVDELEAQIRTEVRRKERFRASLRELNVVSHEQSASGSFIEIPIEPLRNANPVILKRYFRKLWRRMKWPLAEMGYDEWNRLVEIMSKGKASRQFPGNVAALFPEKDVLRLERLVHSEGAINPKRRQ
ncbi:MAG: tRNA lysidine(34) synthetase TilS [Thermoguttaceae bacterium]